ncbi:AfsA-related hotdog domain-containing protein [Streptomyces sp. NPDC031705]|uniref:AfsA-related hotdog domain-containing protein n=1 Tax=Streptomyces sp. NPDC031705 TaxID=3155729 RepID=UPI0033C438E0
MTTAVQRISQELVHRANPREILVSPPSWDAEHRYHTMTVTTDISPYYLDHHGRHRLDLLLMTEACRQAAMSAAHRYEGLPLDVAAFFNTIDVRLSNVGTLMNSSGELLITTSIEEMKLRGDGSPKQIVYSQQAVVTGSDKPVLSSRMAVQGVAEGRYPDLRAYQRGGLAAPTTASMRATFQRHQDTAEPERVGRTQTANVVLAGLRRTADGATAILDADLANVSLFDHDYDHYPAMVLIEAGRQLALACTDRAVNWIISGCRAEFPGFAELDTPTAVVARQYGNHVEVVCRQNDLVVTRMWFELTSMVSRP